MIVSTLALRRTSQASPTLLRGARAAVLGAGQARLMERPQRGQCARAHRSSCWPQRQSVVRAQCARPSDVSLTLVFVSVRVTSLISQFVLVVLREPTRRSFMTAKLRL